MDAKYKICLSDYERLLPELAQLIAVEYKSGSFEEAEEKFHAEGSESVEWVLSGKYGRLSIKLEKYEGYYFSCFSAPQPQFQKGKELLWKRYLAEGGNPGAQEQP